MQCRESAEAGHTGWSRPTAASSSGSVVELLVNATHDLHAALSSVDGNGHANGNGHDDGNGNGQTDPDGSASASPEPIPAV